MIYNTKTFYAVGQGGFYSERIWSNGMDYTIVYDCGAVVDKSLEGPTIELGNAIDNSGFERIDFVVISHLDEDHINGLKKLNRYVNQIGQKRPPVLILPNPTPLDRLLFFSSVSIKTMEIFFDIISNQPVLCISSEGDNDETEIALNADWKKGMNNPFSHNRVFTLFGCTDCSEKWLLKFYVDRSKYALQFDLLLKKEPALIDLIKSIKSIKDFEFSKEKLVRAYKKISEKGKTYGDKNWSSMAMISAPFIHDMQTRNCERGVESPYISWMNGDIRLKDDNEMLAIEQHFADFLSLNIDFQIPHHGSHNNLGRIPAFNRRVRTYIWAGEDNQYGHPHGTILRMLKRAGLKINWITENDSHIVRHEKWL